MYGVLMTQYIFLIAHLEHSANLFLNYNCFNTIGDVLHIGCTSFVKDFFLEFSPFYIMIGQIRTDSK